MVELMKKGESELQTGKMMQVKMEVEDPLEEEHGPLNKRPKQLSQGMGAVAVPVSQCNPLDEPSPLGLQLRKSPSLLELIQMKLSQATDPKVASLGHGRKDQKGGASSGTTDKLKASNFLASTLRIGTWEYKSRYEGDLVAKCYFAKHKLVWEVLDGGLKNKIEIQWSDIMALKANYSDDAHGTLDVLLARQPLFFRETNPQPRKHTLWQATSDFTGGHASIHRRHYLECPQGLLGKHFEKLIQCDPRLNFLSQQGEIRMESPYFESRMSGFDDPSENNTFDAASSSGAQSSSSKFEQDAPSRYSDSYHLETPSPSSVRDTLTIEDIRNGGMKQLKALSNWDQIMVHGLRPSMSMSDLVSHLEHRMSEQKKSENPTLSSDEWQSLQILEDINRCLFSDFQNMPESDEKCLMSRVNSLCCLLQKDPEKKADILANFHPSTSEIKVEVNNDASDDKPAALMSRKDSVGELLLNLPRIASLPQFLFNISEDFENQAR